jgi:hypothetical protein
MPDTQPEVAQTQPLAPPPNTQGAPLSDQMEMGVEKPDPAVDSLLNEQREGVAKLRSLQTQEETAVEGRNAQLAQLRKEMLGSMSGLQPPPKLQPYQEPPDVRAKDAEAFKGYFFPMLVMSALMGRAAKGGMIDALNNLSMGMRGFQEGRTQYAKSQTDLWHNKMLEVGRENERRIREYQMTVENRDLSMQDKELQLKLTAAEHDDTVMLAKLKSGNQQTILEQVGKMQMQQDRAEKLHLQYYVKMQQELHHRETLQLSREKAQENIRQFNERMDFARTKIDNTTELKVINTYNDGLQKWTARLTNTMQRIMADPFGGSQPERIKRSIDILAHDYAQEMGVYNSRLREAGYPVPKHNEELENWELVRAAMLGGGNVAPPEGMAPPSQDQQVGPGAPRGAVPIERGGLPPAAPVTPLEKGGMKAAPVIKLDSQGNEIH